MIQISQSIGGLCIRLNYVTIIYSWVYGISNDQSNIQQMLCVFDFNVQHEDVEH